MDEQLLKTVHASLAFTFGTSAPYAISHISGERVGFAGIPTVRAIVHCRPEDIPAVTPIVRQRVYRELAERGWTPDHIEFRPTVQQNRRCKFTDDNESSESYGRGKMGNEHRYTFEMNRELAKATFGPYGSGSYRPLPERNA